MGLNRLFLRVNCLLIKKNSCSWIQHFLGFSFMYSKFSFISGQFLMEKEKTVKKCQEGQVGQYMSYFVILACLNSADNKFWHFSISYIKHFLWKDDKKHVLQIGSTPKIISQWAKFWRWTNSKKSLSDKNYAFALCIMQVSDCLYMSTGQFLIDKWLDILDYFILD